MSRTFLVIFFIVTFGIFGFLFAGGSIFKQPFTPDEDIADFLTQLEEALGPAPQPGLQSAPQSTSPSVPQWDLALELQSKTEKAWSRIEKRIQLSVEKNNMTAFTEQLVRLKAFIEMEDQPGAWEALALLKTTWHRMR